MLLDSEHPVEKQPTVTLTWRCLWTWFHGESSGLDDLHLQAPVPLHQTDLYVTWDSQQKTHTRTLTMRMEEVSIRSYCACHLYLCTCLVSVKSAPPCLPELFSSLLLPSTPALHLPHWLLPVPHLCFSISPHLHLVPSLAQFVFKSNLLFKLLSSHPLLFCFPDVTLCLPVPCTAVIPPLLHLPSSSVTI